MDVWLYFEQRRREFAELSLAPEEDTTMFAEEHGSNGERGRVFGRLFLNERAYLQVSETVVVVDDHVHREDYAYFLVIDEEEVWGEERDPTHDPAVHRHTEGHRREPSVAKSFKRVAEEAWAEVTRRVELGELSF